MEKRDMLRDVFDAIPSPVFIVDQDVSIQEYNAAAADLPIKILCPTKPILF